MIELKNVEFRYRDESAFALQGISLKIKEGEFVALIGPNGSGKSTLAELFNGLLLPVKGEVLVDGINSRSDPWRLRQRVGMVFQNPDHQFFHCTVEEDVAFGPENLGFDKEEVLKRVIHALREVDMGEFRRISPERLSGGQKQAAAIAGALAMDPKYLILDEPTSLLDPANRRMIFEIVTRLHQKKGHTILWITQDMNEAARAERVIVLDQGKILLDGSPERVFAEAELLTEMGLDIPRVFQLAHLLKSEGIDPKRVEIKMLEKILKVLQ